MCGLTGFQETFKCIAAYSSCTFVSQELFLLIEGLVQSDRASQDLQMISNV